MKALIFKFEKTNNVQSKSEVKEVKHPQSAWTRAAHFCGRYASGWQVPGGSIAHGLVGKLVAFCFSAENASFVLK